MVPVTMLCKRFLMELIKPRITLVRCFAKHSEATKDIAPLSDTVDINGKKYKTDDFTNVTPRILSYLGMNIYNQSCNPINLLKQRIINFFYSTFIGRRGNPLFSVHDNLPPVVSVEKNFDSLLIPIEHPSRQKGDNYYINSEYLLRAHTTAHQSELIKMGLDNFLILGDVYRRDEIDSTHFPVFHQMDGVRLFTCEKLSEMTKEHVQVFEESPTKDTDVNQAEHSELATRIVEEDLKSTLVSLMEKVLGTKIKHRWVSAYFPFTHPSWELEIDYNGKWLELLGCGIIRNKILIDAGAKDKIGWAFGMGLERIAMHLYKIPDIRLFWSQDSGFVSQFKTDDIYAPIVYKAISIYPQCANDISFWLPSSDFCDNDFYDLARNIGGNIIEQITLIDEFHHPKTGRVSRCYRVIYRHMEKTLTQKEVNEVQFRIRDAVNEVLKGEVR